jgi:hypothetical protein
MRIALVRIFARLAKPDIQAGAEVLFATAIAFETD